jgi:hypothetical protein
MSSYGAKGTRTPNNRLQRTVRYAARRTGAMGYVPDLHKIWVGTSDQQLMALSNEFPGFYRYALIIEEASEAERNKHHGPMMACMAGFSEEHKQRAAQLLVTAANLERGYQAFRGSGNLRRKFLGFRLATPSRHGQMRKMGLL